MNVAAPFAFAMLCTALAATPAGAQTNKPKPGLWEYTMSMGGGQNSELAAAQDKMAAELAKMPPEQRKMAEGIMAKRGTGMGGGVGGGTTVQVCLTQERIDREDFGSGRGDCSKYSNAHYQ